MNKPSSPIGLFDSGVGGLTVAAAIKSILPGESMIYFGDTAHLPYGDKSKQTIIRYSLEITDFLLDHDCKVILIACNSASSNAFSEVRDHVGDRALVMNVIDPVVDHVAGETDIKHVGVIGTKATIGSGTYADKLHELRPSLEISSMATPLFVPMIEEGFIFDDISNAIIRSYLSKRDLENIDSLILGCTHYPIIMNQISRFFNFDVNVIDSARLVAGELKNELSAAGLLNSGSVKGEYRFHVSDLTDYFAIIARMFFGENITLQKTDIGRQI
ncbi:MAG TPA: glutamate racemase [Bacteroidales bacterium]|nr:glutamate racemase [Bacteroidales bacterium]